jgi:hypothetical protein
VRIENPVQKGVDFKILCWANLKSMAAAVFATNELRHSFATNIITMVLEPYPRKDKVG